MNRMFRIPMFLFVFIVFLQSASDIRAEESGPLPHAEELTGKLGWIPDEAYSRLGSPDGIFPFRGSAADEDNVVFYYSDHLYLFWFQDRVWQLRVDERWKGTMDGVHMGMMMSEVINLWGPPINDRDEQPTWTLPDRGYPVRIRLYFDSSGRLSDIYVYRSDW